jgi:deazaflavin-dependent oxidoreductase (nitroreductase family)
MSVTDTLQHQALRAHDALYKASGGRVGHRILGVPALLLTTTGRRSGQPRTASLMYARDGERYLVTASNGGADRPPAWLLNVRADPRVAIQVGRRRQDATATVIDAGDPDYERVFRIADEANHGRYSAYQRRTERPIAVVALTPNGA